MALPPGIAARASGLPALPHDVAADGPWWQSWEFDPTFALPVLLLAWWYVRGLTRWPERTRTHPTWRTGSFLGGVALLLLSRMSPLDRLAAQHLTFHMVQHEVVMMLAVPAILLGAPATPVLRGLPRWLRQGLVRPVAASGAVQGVFRVLTGPVAAGVAFVGTVWVWHLVPGFYDAALRSPVLHAFQHMTFLAAAGLFWWNIIEAPPHRPRLSPMPRILYLVAVGAMKDGAAVLIVFASTPLYSEYRHVAGILDWGPLRDQQIGGLVMWVPSTLLMLAVAGATFLTWYRQPEAAARET